MNGNSAITMVAGVVLVSASLRGQSMNIDFGNEGGAPPSSYAAAGLPGTWNICHQPWKFPPPPVIGPFALVDLAGNPTSATLSAFDSLGTFDNTSVGPTGGDAQLLNDGLIGHTPDVSQHIYIEGLQNGVYRVISYTWVWPADSYGMAVLPNGSFFTQPVGGPWPGELALGVTHMVHVVEITKGELELQVQGAGPGAFFNGNNLIQGLQLWKIELPECPADVAPDGGNGNVNVDDLLAVINGWGPCVSVPRCPPDVNGDGAVNVDDLLAVINGWGPCPEVTPGICGKPSLTDCYVAHESGGCSEPECCSLICELDSYCCNVAWDELCVGLANISAACVDAVHPNCGSPSSGSCFENADTLPGCNESACCAAVCAADPFCCNFTWDQFCVDAAAGMCRKP